jgi:hypothetical protein
MWQQQRDADRKAGRCDDPADLAPPVEDVVRRSLGPPKRGLDRVEEAVDIDCRPPRKVSIDLEAREGRDTELAPTHSPVQECNRSETGSDSAGRQQPGPCQPRDAAPLFSGPPRRNRSGFRLGRLGTRHGTRRMALGPGAVAGAPRTEPASEVAPAHEDAASPDRGGRPLNHRLRRVAYHVHGGKGHRDADRTGNDQEGDDPHVASVAPKPGPAKRPYSSRRS